VDRGLLRRTIASVAVATFGVGITLTAPPALAGSVPSLVSLAGGSGRGVATGLGQLPFTVATGPGGAIYEAIS
jgi:hypothetical protein